MSAPKFNIYKGVVCLETPSPNGGKWWFQGHNLGYTPYPIYNITHIRHGFLEGTRREILAARIQQGTKMTWVAINPPRSDIFTLMERNLWPESMAMPYTKQPIYAKPPEPLK